MGTSEYSPFPEARYSTTFSLLETETRRNSVFHPSFISPDFGGHCRSRGLDHRHGLGLSVRTPHIIGGGRFCPSVATLSVCQRARSPRLAQVFDARPGLPPHWSQVPRPKGLLVRHILLRFEQDPSLQLHFVIHLTRLHMSSLFRAPRPRRSDAEILVRSGRVAC